jgi:hypothetical protein
VVDLAFPMRLLTGPFRGSWDYDPPAARTPTLGENLFAPSLRAGCADYAGLPCLNRRAHKPGNHARVGPCLARDERSMNKLELIDRIRDIVIRVASEKEDSTGRPSRVDGSRLLGERSSTRLISPDRDRTPAPTGKTPCRWLSISTVSELKTYAE